MFRRLTPVAVRMPPSDRYQLSTLQGRYSTLCERWERLQAEKEAGRRPGVHGGFSTPEPGDLPGTAAAKPRPAP